MLEFRCILLRWAEFHEAAQETSTQRLKGLFLGQIWAANLEQKRWKCWFGRWNTGRITMASVTSHLQICSPEPADLWLRSLQWRNSAHATLTHTTLAMQILQFPNVTVELLCCKCSSRAKQLFNIAAAFKTFQNCGEAQDSGSSGHAGEKRSRCQRFSAAAAAAALKHCCLSDKAWRLWGKVVNLGGIAEGERNQEQQYSAPEALLG